MSDQMGRIEFGPRDPHAFKTGEELASIVRRDSTEPVAAHVMGQTWCMGAIDRRALLAHIAALEGQVAEARAEVRRLWELGSRHEQESIRLADENALWKQRAEEAERQRDELRAVAIVAEARERVAPNHGALCGCDVALRIANLDTAWPGWRDAPPRVADPEGA